MESFYYVVLTIAVVFLILILIFVGIMMQGQNKGQSFPPVANVCPDFWTIASDNKSCIVPGTTGNTYSTTPTGQNVGTIGTALSKYATDTLLNSAYASGTVPYKFASSVIINPNDAYWSKNGKTATCGQKQWATQTGIQWGGVSNYNSC